MPETFDELIKVRVPPKRRMSKTDKFMHIGFASALTIVFTFLCISAHNSFGIGQPSMAAQVKAITGVDSPKIIYTNDKRNCGANNKKYAGDEGGCYDPDTPNVIYVSPNLPFEVNKYIILHETGHFEQFKNNKPFSECGADAYAAKYGADTTLGIYYTKCHPTK